MDRQTKKVTRHKFTFPLEELSSYGLTSEKLDYMEATARNSLKEDGYFYTGGEMFFDMSDDYDPHSPALLTILI